MDWTDLAPLLGGGGIVGGLGIIAYVFLRLHLSAVNAHREGKAEWRALALERERQLMEIVGAVRDVRGKVP